MAKFIFRLQKVLEYRADLETAAKNAYLGKRLEVLASEAIVSKIKQRRLDVLSEPRTTIAAYRLLETELIRLDDDERAERVVLSVLYNEEETLRKAWTKQKQELEAVVKLREKAFDEWTKETDRREQAELDEWSVLRRIA